MLLLAIDRWSRSAVATVVCPHPDAKVRCRASTAASRAFNCVIRVQASGVNVPQDIEQRLATLVGRYAVMNEVVIAVLAAMPNKEAVLRLALRNAQEMRDAAVEANHSKSWMVGVDPDSDDASAWLAGADLEIDSYSKLANLLAKKKAA